jgi:integrase
MILEKSQRIVKVQKFTYEPLTISSDSLAPRSKKVLFKNGRSYFITSSDESGVDDEPFYHFPILLNNDSTAWNEGNLYLLSISNSYDFDYTPTKIARKASQLLDYKIWCETKGVNMFDFSARRPKNRATYAYYIYLHERGISPGNLNQRTSLVYKFTKHFSNKYQIDTKRIDQVTDAFISFKNKQGFSVTKKIEKRKLTKTVSRHPKQVIGQVIDEGESLRPLIETEQETLMSALNNKRYFNDEKLIFYSAIDTGGRKQSILTLRLKHIKSFTKNNLSPDGSYKINAGLGTSVDTKFSKHLTISIPEPLAERLKMYAFSKVAQKRRTKFIKRFGNIFKHEDDIYLFLSSRGDCRYMAKDDPRYLKTKTPPTGGSIQTVINKLYKFDLPKGFPKDYKFHWNRASFALNYYLFLKPLVDERVITYQNLIAFIQAALGHESPETTEKYLNLFTENEKLFEMQSQWEKKFFSRSISDKYTNKAN